MEELPYASANPVSEAEELTRGKFALVICLGGVGLTLFVALAAFAVGPQAIYWAYFFLPAFQVMPLAFGLAACGAPPGRLAAIISGALLLLSLAVVPITLMLTTKPVDESRCEAAAYPRMELSNYGCSVHRVHLNTVLTKVPQFKQASNAPRSRDSKNLNCQCEMNTL